MDSSVKSAGARFAPVGCFVLFALPFAAVGITVRGGPLGFGKPRTMDVDALESFDTISNMSSGNRVWNDLLAVPTSGKPITLAKRLSSKIIERAVIEELNTALNRQ